MSEQVALWYWRYGGVYVSMERSEREAAEAAYFMNAEGGGSPEGAQLSDGQFMPLYQWPMYKTVQEEQRQAEEAADKEHRSRPPRALRTVRVPWDDSRTTSIPAELPPWVGRPA